MIYVNQKQLDQVEYILQQSAQGHHILFENDEIRRVFETARLTIKTDAEPRPQRKLDGKGEPTEAEKHIENLILQPSIVAKKNYLENLTPEMFQDVVRTYFSIVENNIFEGMEFCH